METPVVGDALTKPTDVTRPERAAAARIETEGGIDFRPEFASFGARFVGLLIDGAVLAVSMVPGIALIVTGSTGLVVLGVALLVAAFIGVTILYARSVAATGQWLGNRAMSTKIVDARNGRLVPASSAAARFVVRMLISPILLIGFLMALGNPERRTFHDQFAGTVVTRPPRATWSIDDGD